MTEPDISYIYAMIKSRQFIIFLFLTVSMAANGQYTKEFKRIFFDADYLFQTEFYEEAFNRYKNLLTLDPGNSNILFHCGACCLNIPGSEQLAITYLKESVVGVTQSYKDRSHKESGAPVITYYMLGQAYHLNNEFDKAIENYKLFQDASMDEDPLQLEYVKLQIEACGRAAKVVVDRPSFEFQSVLDHFDEDLPSCNNPVISGDGNILIFLVDYPSDKKIMMTTRSGKLWSRPRVINSEIGMVGDTYPVSLSYDGKDLYFVHQFYSHSDIFISKFEGGRWSEGEALGQNINGRTSENHASISKDGKTLYFTSDARGGLGSFDIFVSLLDDSGEWGPPSNLGPIINTPYEELTPFISSNDSILFFSSQGHASIGGVDVFYTELNSDGSWSEPINMGFPVNTTGDNLFFNPGWDELEGYYAVRREDDPASNTINMVIELEPVEPEETVTEREIEPVTEPVTEEVTGAVAKEGVEPVTEEVPADEKILTITEAIEPVETDRIEEVLNRNADQKVEAPVEVPVEAFEEAPVEILEGPSEIITSIRFESNHYKLNMQSMLDVEKIAVLMIDYPNSKVALTGHTDNTGKAEYNMLLSMQRAGQIAEYLEMRGIGKGRLSVDGKGEGEPIARNRFPDGEDAPLGRYLNRQVIVTITDQSILKANIVRLYVPNSLKSEVGVDDSSPSNPFWFTIQLKASYSPINTSQFHGINDVKEFKCTDKYYRYTTGAYKTFQDARDQLKKVHKMGFEDAYIQTLEWYGRVVHNLYDSF